MKIPHRLKIALIAIGGVALGIQLIPAARSNPPVVRELVWDSPRTLAFARRACFDCHSNETRWPWYSYVAPVSWLIARDVKEARDHLNFSEISADDRAEPLAKRIQAGEMPLPKYLALHGEARLSETEKTEFIAGLRRSFELSGLGANETHERGH